MNGAAHDWNGGLEPATWQDWIEQRLEERLRELGSRRPVCSVADCAESNPFALVGVHPNIVCYEHSLDRQGRAWTEQHHWLGRQNDPFSSPIPGNDHRLLSTSQGYWPRQTLRNRDGSPLLKAAAALRSWLDVVRLLIERVLGWVPPFLEWLDAALRERIGERWWDELGWSEP